MPKIDLAEVEKEESKKQLETNDIETKKIGDKTFFKGKILHDWFDSYGECQSENQKAALQKRYVDSGLDEYGRGKAQVALAAEVARLQSEKQKFLDKAAAIDAQIGSLSLKDFEEAAMQTPEKHQEA